jgi:hypothetical protein
MSDRARSVMPLVCLVAATWLTFAPVITADFVQWDDPNMIWQNPALNPPSWPGLQSAWIHPVNKLYMPVTATAWELVATVQGKPAGQVLSAWPYHLLNLIIHTAAVLLAFVFLKELTCTIWPACIGAMIFALHPLQVESVAWASETKDLLCGAFSMAALLSYSRYARVSKAAGPLFALATVFYALALLSKSAAVSVPLVAFAMDRWSLKRPAKKSLALILWIAMAVPILIIARQSQPSHLLIPMAWRAPVAIDAIGFYVTKIFLPLRLAIDYERSPHWLIAHPASLWRGPLVLLVAVGLIVWRRTSWVCAPLAISLAALLPVLGLFSFDFQDYSTVADHYMYLPMIGIALAATLFIQRQPKLLILVVIVLVLFAARSFVQATTWHDTESLAANQFKIDPDSSTAHKILAAWLSAHGRDVEADKEFRAAAIALDGEGKTGVGIVWFDYGNLLLREGRIPEAIEQYQQALKRQPPEEQTRTLNNLGMAYYHAGDLNAARQSFSDALRIDPNYAEARQNLSRLDGD